MHLGLYLYQLHWPNYNITKLYFSKNVLGLRQFEPIKDVYH